MSTGPLVMHYRSLFLPASETFTRTLIAHHQRYRAEVVTHERVTPSSLDPAPVHVLPESAGGLHGLARRWIWAARLPQRRAVIRSALDRLRPALIHAHFGEDAVVASAAARASGLPSVAAFYGYDATVLARSPFWRRRFRRLFVDADAVLAEGPAMAERLAALGCPADRLVIQPIPIDLRLFPFRPPAPRGERTMLLQACRFVEKKGVDLTIEAFARLAADDAGLHLRLIGDGPERMSLERMARQSGAADRIQFLGARTHAEYARDLAEADIFVQPSRTAANGDGEGGAPTTLLEAQAVGLPIVASDHADLPWVVSAGGALLAREGDVAQLSELLGHLLAHREEWGRRALAGRRHVVERHAVGTVIGSLERLYDRILASPGRGPAA